MSEKTVLAIDPGSSKCGMAVVRRDAKGAFELLWRLVPSRDELSGALTQAHGEHPFSLVVVGSGTKSKDVVHEVRERLPGMGILVVDEKDTSLNARERYWEHHPRRIHDIPHNTDQILFYPQQVQCLVLPWEDFYFLP